MAAGGEQLQQLVYQPGYPATTASADVKQDGAWFHNSELVTSLTGAELSYVNVLPHRQ